ncbi:quinone-dependent dihydroorotate dehydrogenase [Sutterella megalosphaeroides]|uniref:Dihydroorotate dehydrogenase (quinone) n=1 Tax=Sutterella megalosphaeroides TaxID=2494234 RepID=A0A2Z6I8D7_9BURK|nr:quinone-dependent dihydroorotate dehydrogenase [Sutterella megalosphaeroides]BBF22654.1 dihydroorotate dehydrogenase (quinone) [Sutterella megalosphaeroides]
MTLYNIARRVLFSMNPETAHAVTMANLDWVVHTGLHKLITHMPDEDPVTVMGVRFPNTIGLAAGMDKDGTRVSAFGGLGFGHVEIGTITPLAQPGNPKPRLFRLIPAEGVINRMGFNNEGVVQVLENLRSADAFRLRGGVLGINIGKNAVTPIENALSDYVKCLDAVYDHADYIAVNISSPNTKNLRTLQGEGELDHLVKGITEKRADLKAQRNGKHVPIAVKLAPDLENDEILRCVDTLMKYGIDAVIATNTTIGRKRVQGLLHAEETGGLSGAPLRERSTEVVRLVAEHVKGELPIIASGGVMSGADAVEKMEAGAQLVQLFTGFIYKGPALIAECSEAVAAWRRSQQKR